MFQTVPICGLSIIGSDSTAENGDKHTKSSLMMKFNNGMMVWDFSHQEANLISMVAR